MKKYTTILIIIFQVINCLGQASLNMDTICNMVVLHQDDLLKLQIEKNKYSFYWLNSESSQIPLMTDYSNLKVIYFDSLGLEINEPEPMSLKVITEQIILDTVTRKIAIEGYVLDGWYGAKSDVHIFIGQRVDTLKPLYTPILDSDEKTGRKPFLLDHYPSFYLKDYSHFKSEVGFESHMKRAFKLNSIINDTSILLFGLKSCYVEMFEIGRIFELYKQ